MTMLPEDRRAEAARAFGLWRAAGSNPERHKHLIRLWELCGPEIECALKDIAAKEPSVGVWLERHNLGRGDVANAAYLAVEAAARKYDPDHESGAAFPTFAMKYIKGEVARIGKDSSPLPKHEGPEDRAPEEREDLPLDLDPIVAWALEHRNSEIAAVIYEATKYPDEYSSEALRQMAEVIQENFAEELDRDTKLQTLRISLGAMATRAEDYEGKMVDISRLVSILAERDAHKTRGMPAETYSAKALHRLFGKPSDKTLAKWLKACDEQGVTSQNWTPEQLARIVWSRRGPRFRGRRVPPTSRPKQ